MVKNPQPASGAFWTVAKVKSLVLASFSSYRIRSYIRQKYNLPPLLPAV